jgi:tRNA pseudouridine13 synthase
LWNQSLEHILLQHIKNPLKAKGKIMDYYFYQTLEENTSGSSMESDNNPVPLTPFEEDDIYKAYLKLKLKFTLPPGSFATMLVKSQAHIKQQFLNKLLFYVTVIAGLKNLL